jgi:hypothetical protein
MYYSYVEIEYVATSFSPARTDLALKLLSPFQFMDFILIGIDNHASWCMANGKRLFEDLHLNPAKQQFGGINDGLVIVGWGTLVITLNDNSGRPHRYASCCPSIGYKRQETTILCQMAQGWKTTQTIVS